jgi:hypothetical protein
MTWRGGAPGVFVVLSNEGPQTIDLIYTTRSTDQAKNWRYFRGVPTANTIEFQSATGVQRSLSWKNGDSGVLTLERGDRNIGDTPLPFTRLDG